MPYIGRKVLTHKPQPTCQGPPVWLVEVLNVVPDAFDVCWEVSAPVLPALSRRNVVEDRAVLPEALGLAAIILEVAPVWKAFLVIHFPCATLPIQGASIST